MSQLVRRSRGATAAATAVALALALALSAAAFAQAPAAVASPPPTGAPLARALDTVSADEIRSDIFFIASDELGGRDTPSNGLRVAARFIQNRLERLGFHPGAPEGRFLYSYPLLHKRVAEPATRATLRFADPGPDEKPLALVFGEDYAFGDLRDVTTSGGVVCCGTGSANELRKSETAGKWVLIWESGERGRAPVDEQALEQSKAIGVIVAPAPGVQRDSRQIARFAARYRKGRVEYPGPEEAAAAPRGVARVSLSAAGRDKLLEFAGATTPAAGDDLKVVFEETRAIVPDGRIECEDVCAFWPGSDPELSKEVILVSAHYDHVGTSEDGTIYNGADDNGSGTCGLLALAEALVEHGPMRRSVMILWVSGEEKGLYGSRAWSDKPFFPNGGRAVANINMDMIGRNAKNQILITPTAQHPAYNGLTRLAESFFADEGFTEIKSADEYYGRSDHAMFARLGIPITFLFNDVHADYHKPTDKPEKIDNDKIRRIVRVVLRMLDAMQSDALDLGNAKKAASPGVK